MPLHPHVYLPRFCLHITPDCIHNYILFHVRRFSFPHSKFWFTFLYKINFADLKHEQVAAATHPLTTTLSPTTTSFLQTDPTCCQSTPCVCDGFLFLEFWIFCLASVLWSLEGICKFKIKSLFYGPWDFLMLVQAPSMGAAKFADFLELNS